MPTDDGDEPRPSQRDKDARRDGRRFIELLTPHYTAEELDAYIAAIKQGAVEVPTGRPGDPSSD